MTMTGTERKQHSVPAIHGRGSMVLLYGREKIESTVCTEEQSTLMSIGWAAQKVGIKSKVSRRRKGRRGTRRWPLERVSFLKRVRIGCARLRGVRRKPRVCVESGSVPVPANSGRSLREVFLFHPYTALLVVPPYSGEPPLLLLLLLVVVSFCNRQRGAVVLSTGRVVKTFRCFADANNLPLI